ncbi:MAG: ion transporter [Deltaproteobacteria bacterium]|nr:ion transporter [Deltaproteobacteria bacterium]
MNPDRTSPLFDALHAAFHQPGTRPWRWVEGIIWALIIVSSGLMFLDFFFWETQPVWLVAADRGILIIFAMELLLRVVSYKSNTADVFVGGHLWRVRTHIAERVVFLISPMQLLDLVVILSFLPQLRGLRILRILRLVRGVRLFKYSDPLRDIVRTFEENSLLYAFTFTFLTIVVTLGGVTFYLVEAGNNPSVTSVQDGLWWALVTVTTVGYGDVTPASLPLGRLIGGVVMILGMFTLALFAGIVSSTLLRVLINLRGDQFRMSNYTNHIVVVGYNNACNLLLDALLKETSAHQNELLVFAEGDRPQSLPSDFIWVSGNPSRESELDKVKISSAKVAIVVGARDLDPPQADAATIMNIFTIRSYMEKKGMGEKRKQPIYIVAEILDPENVDHALTAGANEVIETTRLGFSMMAHAALMPGTGAIMSKVASAGAHSLYISPNPRTREMVFEDLADGLHREYGLILLGIQDPISTKVTMDPGDQTVVGAHLNLVYLSKAPIPASPRPGD